MQTQTKQKEVFLTQAQFDARKTAGTLEQGVVYHITDGIQKSDLSQAVQTSLGKADTALQASDISGKADKTYVDSEISRVEGEIPTVPTNVSAFTNDAGYLTQHQDISGKANTADLLDGTLIPALAKNIESKPYNDNAEFSYRPTAGHADIESGTATLDKIKGNTVVMNQMLNQNFTDTSLWSGYNTSAVELDDEYQITGDNFLNCSQGSIAGHKYMYGIEVRSVEITGETINAVYANAVAIGHVDTIIADGQFHKINVYGNFGSASSGFLLRVYKGIAVKKNSLHCFDLTAMFGAGNEPTTTDDPRIKWLDSFGYIPYNEGQLLSMKMTGIETVGFNQWDEETEISNNLLTSKNFNKCFPNTPYTIYCSSIERFDYVIFRQYDINKNQIESNYFNSTALQVTTKPNAAFFKVTFNSGYGLTYMNDVCINLSHSGSRNGEYEPYWSAIREIDVTKLTSNGVTIFPDGLKSAGTAHDEIVGNKAIKRIGTRAYQSGDESDASVVTDGTNANYILATPVEYIIDNVPNYDYRVSDWGTEKILPYGLDAQGLPATTPIKADIHYGINVADTVKNLPHTYRRNDVQDAIDSRKIELTTQITAGEQTFTLQEWINKLQALLPTE